MLRSINNLFRYYRVLVKDGEIGRVHDFLKKLDEQGINIPFAIRPVYFHDETEKRNRSNSRRHDLIINRIHGVKNWSA